MRYDTGPVQKVTNCYHNTRSWYTGTVRNLNDVVGLHHKYRSKDVIAVVQGSDETTAELCVSVLLSLGNNCFVWRQCSDGTRLCPKINAP